MIAHLYKIPSTFLNIPDMIKIKAKPRTDYPGTWLHAELSLPDSLRVIVDDEGDGHLLTVPGNEIISSVYEEEPEHFEGNTLVSHVNVIDNAGNVLLRCKVNWR